MKELTIDVFLTVGESVFNLDHTLTVQVDDDATQEDIHVAKERATFDWVYNYIDFGWADSDKS